MKHSHPQVGQRGFTLIEVMIVVAIIAILASIAIPSYNDYVRRSRTTEATATLSAKRARIEMWFDNKREYKVTADGTQPDDCNLDTTTSNSFDFQCSAITATTYTLTATGKSTMAGFSYTINEQNVRTSTITGVNNWTATSATCWIVNKGGLC